MRFLRTLLETVPRILAAIFIGTTMTLLLLFPRVINELADVMGTVPTFADTLIHIVIAVVIDALLLYLAVILPWRRARRSWDMAGLIVEKGQGRAYLDIESARQQIYAAVVRVPDIQRAEVTIDNVEGRAAVKLAVVSSPTINAPRKKADLRREIQKVLEDQLGIRLAGEPTISISLTPLNEERSGVTVSPPSPAPAPASVREPAPAPARASTPTLSTPEPAPSPLPPYPSSLSRPITPRTPEAAVPSVMTPIATPTMADQPRPERNGLAARLFGRKEEEKPAESLNEHAAKEEVPTEPVDVSPGPVSTEEKENEPDES
ncbi:MAG TPA: hypothetical protein VMT34_05525 [Aggregatilineales bacterium]|nr:hypothetical protein [Aggregatilineales bacterium]